MELSINIGYEQLLRLVRQLPHNDKKKLNNEIEKDLMNTGSKEDMNEFQEFLLQGPSMTDEQFNNFKELRKNFNQWLLVEK